MPGNELSPEGQHPSLPPLLSGVALGGLHLANRIVVSPMAQYTAVEGKAQDWHIQHLGSLAVSGPGLVIVESNAIEPAGYGCSDCLALHSDAQEAALKRIMDIVRPLSQAKFGIQIGHSGRKASVAVPAAGGRPLFIGEGGWQTVAPSALAFGDGWPVPAALDGEGLRRVRAGFVDAARRAARIGFDLVELHGAHGYLLHSFLSPLSNRRTDAYGGSPENRTRFVREVVAAVREAYPKPLALGIRLNSRDWAEGGLEVEDTIAIAVTLKEAGLDYVCISAGAISSGARIPSQPGYLADDAGRVRAGAGIATMVTGVIYEAELANGIVAAGKADAVAIARAFLDDPRWVWHAARRLNAPYEVPMQYMRAQPPRWPGGIFSR